MKDDCILDWFEINYPQMPKGSRTRTINCVVHAYSAEIEYPWNLRKIPTKNFFSIIASKTDKELLEKRNLGRGKLRLLREAQKKYMEQAGERTLKTKFNYISADWKRVKNHCRTTDNKDFSDKEASEEFKKKLLISEHSPIRLIEIDWSWEDIYSWVATHWSRHKFEKFISTQRDDRKEHDIPRGEMPQNTPVKFDGYANMQNLIDAFRKRLCYQASPETRKLAEDFKLALHEVHPELADILVPNCVYRCGCPEFKPCGFTQKFVGWVATELEDDYIGGWLKLCGDIQRRYDLYNEYFYEKHKTD